VATTEPPAGANPPPTGIREAATVLTATTGALTFSATTALFPAAIAPAIADAMGVSPSLIGVQISLLYLGAMITSLVGGGIARRLGACRTTQWAVAIFGMGGLLAAAANLWVFLAASLLIGFGYGLTNPAASHLLVRFTDPRRRGLVFGLKQTGVPLGGVIAGALAPLLAVNYGWQAAMAALSVPAIAAIALLQWPRARWDEDRQPRARWLAAPLEDIRLVWSIPPMRKAAMASFCFSTTQLCLTVFTVTLLVEDLSIGLITAGGIMALVQISGVAGRIGWGWVADRTGNSRATLGVVGGLAAAFAGAVTLMRGDWPIWLITMVLCGFAAVALGWNGVYLAEITHLAPRDQIARASGGSLVITFGGVLFGPAAFTAIHGVIGDYTTTFAAVALSSLVGAWLAISSGRRGGHANVAQ